MKHRRSISLFSAAVMGITAMSVLSNDCLIAEAFNKRYKGFIYDELGNNQLVITDYYGSKTEIDIPDKIYGKKVTEIHSDALKFKKITKVTVPSSVTEIGYCAFYGCKSLKELIIEGPSHVADSAFSDCEALTEISLNDCTLDIDAFSGCSSLTKINGKIPWSKNSDGMPILTTDSYVHRLIEEVFIKCNDDIGFINNYCDALCTYIVNTETKDWMSDMLKARQLHDWLIRHCEYEDCKNGEDIGDPENQNCCGLFVSYALDGMGESVCTGYSKAFQKLLAKCGIESELLYELGYDPSNNNKLNHVWNLVKIGNVYYHCDVTQDNNLTDGSNMAYGTYYSSFMRSTYDMYSVHLAHYSNYHTVNEGAYKTTEAAEKAKKALNNCSSNSMRDKNQDGILDGDWNFDGTANRRDNDYYRALCSMMYNCLGQDITDKGVDFMPEYILILNDLTWSPDYLYNTFG